MEEFAILFNALVIIGAVAVSYGLQRKNTRRLMEDLKETVLRESDR